MFSIEDGKKLISMARNAVEKRKVVKKYGEKFKVKKGVFVTIKTYPEEDLRGCIGFPYPRYELGEGVQLAAIGAAFNDPRFPPLSKDELDSTTFEISILSEPEEVGLKDVKKWDGLILLCKGRSALFLPQVWSVLKKKEDFLSNLCLKAGLDPECYKEASLFKFTALVFSESKPKGSITSSFFSSREL